MPKTDVLHLNLKGEYFDAIKCGDKVEEYREYNDYWRNRLEGREYSRIDIKRGYPKRDDYSKIESRPYRGYEIKTITHPHFDNKPIKVFSIWVN
jgi:hypothetical protein